MKSYIKNLISDVDINKGFTLIELLVSMVIMSLVVTLAGTAFVTLLQKNREAEEETQRRTNLNRALDYIANEIRTASAIEPGSATGEVIKLKIPKMGISGTSTSPRYDYLAPDTRTYSIADGTGVWQNDHSKTITLDGNVLVDGIKAPTQDKITEITAACENGDSGDDGDNDDPNDYHTSLVGSNGFYACIYTNEATASAKKADLYLYGKLSDNPNDPDYDKTLEVNKTVSTRSTLNPSTN